MPGSLDASGKGTCYFAHGNRITMVLAQNKKLNIKRLMKGFSHDHSDHDQSKTREMAILQ